MATYYYERSNALGLIIIGEYAGTEKDLVVKSDWNFFKLEELEKTTEKSVKNFIENIHIAVQLRGRKDGKK